MSSFLVSERTMSKLAETICAILNYPKARKYIHYNNGNYLANAFSDCKENYLTYSEYSRQLVGEKLYNMNRNALIARYGDDRWWTEGINPSQYVTFDVEPENLIANRHQFLKYIHCYLYQCCEGEIDKTVLYKALERLVTEIMNDIILSSEEYKVAVWE